MIMEWVLKVTPLRSDTSDLISWAEESETDGISEVPLSSSNIVRKLDEMPIIYFYEKPRNERKLLITFKVHVH